LMAEGDSPNVPLAKMRGIKKDPANVKRGAVSGVTHPKNQGYGPGEHRGKTSEIRRKAELEGKIQILSLI